MGWTNYRFRDFTTTPQPIPNFFLVVYLLKLSSECLVSYDPHFPGNDGTKALKRVALLEPWIITNRNTVWTLSTQCVYLLVPSFPGKCGSQDTRHSDLRFKRYTTRKFLGIGRGVVVKSRKRYFVHPTSIRDLRFRFFHIRSS